MTTRRRKKHRPEEIVAKLRDADAMLSAGKAVARMLGRRLDCIITFCRDRMTNAVAEGLNSKIMANKRRAGGCRNVESFKDVIYFYCGGSRLASTTRRSIPDDELQSTSPSLHTLLVPRSR